MNRLLTFPLSNRGVWLIFNCFPNVFAKTKNSPTGAVNYCDKIINTKVLVPLAISLIVKTPLV